MGDLLDSGIENSEVTHITADPHLGEAVRVRWIDSGLHHEAGWAHLGDFFDGSLSNMECETVGLWMGESKNSVCVGQTRDESNNNWMSAQLIWKPSILGIEWLCVST